MKYLFLIVGCIFSAFLCAQEPAKTQEVRPENSIAKKLSRIDLLRKRGSEKEVGEALRVLAYSQNSLRCNKRSQLQSHLQGDGNVRRRSASLAECCNVPFWEEDETIVQLSDSDEIKSLPNPETSE